jgi:hypothetical protein
VHNKQLVVEVCWWQKASAWQPALLVLNPSLVDIDVPWSNQPAMKESRYCENEGEARAFINHCKLYRALNQPGFVVKLTYEIYSLTPFASGTYDQANPS